MQNAIVTVQSDADGVVRIVRTNPKTKKSHTALTLTDEESHRGLIGALSQHYIELYGGETASVDDEYLNASERAHERMMHVFGGTGDGHGFVAAVKAYDAYLRVNGPLPDNVVEI